MPRIRLDPAALQALAEPFSRAGADLWDADARLGQLHALIGGEAEALGAVENRILQARGQARLLADRAGELADRLRRAAARFAEADQAGAQAIGQVLGAAVVLSWQAVSEAQRAQLTYPQATVRAFSRLGGGGSGGGGGGADSVAMSVPPQADGGRVLIDIAQDKALDRIPGASIAKDAWDLLDSPAQQQRVTAARDAWSAARQQYGPTSAAADSAHQHYLEVYFYGMPVVGSWFELAGWLLQTTATPVGDDTVLSPLSGGPQP
ncbi:MAG: hypothetical protein M3Z04_07655 [Chloroflexota bacterium]|nr:hypothetical protein [Chloroflexota bacterium]